MMRPFTQQLSRSVRLLFAAVAAIFFTTLFWPQLQADELPDTRTQFIELDSAIQAIKEELLAINQEILMLEEASRYPLGEQLVILVSSTADEAVAPASVILLLDGQTVSRHNYSHTERESLQAGGVHRLYAGTPGAGEHELQILLSFSDDPDEVLDQRRSLTLGKKPGRKTIELRLEEGKRRSRPGLAINEWQ